MSVESKYVEAWRARFARESERDRQRAEAAYSDLPAAVKILKKYGAKKVILFGSLRDKESFHSHSDIDLAVAGIPKERFMRAYADLIMALDWPVDLKPLEEVHDFFKQEVLRRGVVLYEE